MKEPVLVIADIHGNLEALKAVFEDAAGRFGEIWVLGDIAGYGPDPDECLRFLLATNSVIVAGNHDLAAAGVVSLSYFNEEALAAILLHQKLLSDTDKLTLKNLPHTIERRSVTLSHGNPANPVWGYVLESAMAASVLAQTRTSLTLVGHTHVPALWTSDASGKAEWIPVQYGEEIRYAGKPHLANPGSVGQTRDGDPSARYMLLNPERKTLSFRRCSWNRRKTRRKMLKRGYPAGLVERMAPR